VCQDHASGVAVSHVHSQSGFGCLTRATAVTLAVSDIWPLGIPPGFVETGMVTGWRSGNWGTGGWLMRSQA